MSDGLADFARMHGTDKLVHGYLPHYERHLGPLRDRPLRFLEIGIGGGGSLRMWHAYLRRSLICGIDIADKRTLASPGITIYQGDQSDPSFLRRVVAETGGLDVVVDDGSHVNENVLTTFRTLFPLMNEGGLYVIEDIHTSYWSRYGGEYQDLNSGRTTASFVKSLVDGLNGHWIPGRVPEEFDGAIDAVHCYPKLVFISKGSNPPVHRPYELRMMQASLADWAGKLDSDSPAHDPSDTARG